ncbi:short chain dehydrogenase [Pseudomonas sp. NPDC090201]|uniref:short chain dehydrogenase n=1 Tax=Pseudomonas sp. NPDC090201 TaxID=3364475 RepID=UPI003820318A
MNNPTGMKTGERYIIENVEGAPEFRGFFLDGKYFLHPELLTAVGWMDGDQFMVDQVSSVGESAFPGGLAGTIIDLTLKLKDGTTLTLAEVEVSAQVDDPADQSSDQANQRLAIQNPAQAFLIATTAAMVVVGYIVGRLLETRRGR